MIICDSHNFIFIHIPRTGGTSITELCEILQLNIEKAFWQHTHAGSEESAEIPFHEYTTFSFVRNPWDRIYSWYALFDKFNPRKEQETFSFEKFLVNYPRIARNYGFDKDFSFNQVDYLRNGKGEFVTDFIGKYETYEQDVIHIFQKLGIEVTHIHRANATNYPPYQTQYSDTTKKLVAELCAEDIEYFGYEFDNNL